MTFNLEIVRSIFDKIILQETINMNDISKLIFDENFKLPDSFISSDDFKQIIEAFNFNSDDKVNIDDFIYLKDHIQDLDVIFKLVKLIFLTVMKFCKLQNIKIKDDDLVDTAIRIIMYCVLFIVATNCVEFKLWAITKLPSGKTNADILFDLLTDIVQYIKTADEVKKITKYVFTFLKDKFSLVKLYCASSPKSADDKIKNANLEIRSIKVQLQRGYATHQLSKKINIAQ